MAVRSLLLFTLLALIVAASAACGGSDNGDDEAGATSAPFPNINSTEELKTRFNEDGGVRLILLLAPTCKTCIDAAAYIEREILSKRPDGDVNVYAIWTAALADDKVSALDASHFSDSRVSQFWDATGDVGRWFPQHEWGPVQKVSGPVAYDVFFLFGPDAVWEDAPAPIASFGGGGTGMESIMRARGDLNRDLSRLLSGE